MASENPDSKTREKTPFHLLTGRALSQRNQSNPPNQFQDGLGKSRFQNQGKNTISLLTGHALWQQNQSNLSNQLHDGLGKSRFPNQGKNTISLLTGHALWQQNQSQDNQGNTNLLNALTYNFKLTLWSDPKTSITFIKNQKT